MCPEYIISRWIDILRGIPYNFLWQYATVTLVHLICCRYSFRWCTRLLMQRNASQITMASCSINITCYHLWNLRCGMLLNRLMVHLEAAEVAHWITVIPWGCADSGEEILPLEIVIKHRDRMGSLIQPTNIWLMSGRCSAFRIDLLSNLKQSFRKHRSWIKFIIFALKKQTNKQKVRQLVRCES